MASEVSVCNQALSRIRAKSINSLTEASIEAQQCSLWYATVRDEAQEAHPWGFNRRTAALSQLAATDVFNWAYVYQYPPDCLYVDKLVRNYEQYTQQTGTTVGYYPRRVEELTPEDLTSPVVFEIQDADPDGKIIVANEPALRAVYRRRVTDPNRFSTQFTVALSALLASRIALAVIGGAAGKAEAKRNLEEYLFLIRAAAINSGNERHAAVPESEYVTTR